MKRRKRALWAGTSLVVLVLAYYVGGNALAQSKEKAVDQTLARLRLDRSSLFTRYPAAERNATATMLSDLVAPGEGSLGLRGTVRTPPWPQGWAVLDEDLDKATDEVALLPEAVRGYLAGNAGRLSTAYRQVRDERPRWEMNLGELERAPVPNLLEQKAIANVILIDCLNKTQQGRSSEALEAFESEWRINQSLRERPELISQLSAISIDEKLGKMIRKLREVPAVWQQRLVAHDYRKSVQESLIFDAWLLQASVKRSPEVMFSPDWGPAVRGIASKLGEPCIRLMAIESLEAVLTSVAAVSERDYCSTEFGFANSVLKNRLSWWNSLGRRAIANVDAGLRVSNVAVLEMEAAQKILRVKEMAAQVGSGRLPRDVSGLESSLYENARWDYRVTADDEFSIKFSREVSYIKGYWLRPEEILGVTWHLKPSAG